MPEYRCLRGPRRHQKPHPSSPLNESLGQKIHSFFFTSTISCSKECSTRCILVGPLDSPNEPVLTKLQSERQLSCLLPRKRATAPKRHVDHGSTWLLVQPAQALMVPFHGDRSGPDQRSDRVNRRQLDAVRAVADGRLELAERVHEDAIGPRGVPGHGQEPGVRCAAPVGEHRAGQIVRVDRHAAGQVDRLRRVAVLAAGARRVGVERREVQEERQQHPRRGEEHVERHPELLGDGARRGADHVHHERGEGRRRGERPGDVADARDAAGDRMRGALAHRGVTRERVRGRRRWQRDEVDALGQDGRRHGEVLFRGRPRGGETAWRRDRGRRRGGARARRTG